MAISNIVKGVKHKFKAFKGKKFKDKLHLIANEFQDVNQAKAAFIESRQKLLNVTGWSFMEGITLPLICMIIRGSPFPEK